MACTSGCVASGLQLTADRAWEHSQVTIERDGRISAHHRRVTARAGNETTFARKCWRTIRRAVRAREAILTAIPHREAGHWHLWQPTQAVGGTALHMAGIKVKAKMAKFAAALMEASDRIWSSERQASSSRGRSLREIVRRRRRFAYIPVPLPAASSRLE